MKPDHLGSLMKVRPSPRRKKPRLCPSHCGDPTGLEHSWTGLMGLTEGLGRSWWPGTRCVTSLDSTATDVCCSGPRGGPHTSGTCMLPSSPSQQQGLAWRTVSKVAEPPAAAPAHCSNSVPICAFLTNFPTHTCNSRKFPVTLVEDSNYL